MKIKRVALVTISVSWLAILLVAILYPAMVSILLVLTFIIGIVSAIMALNFVVSIILAFLPEVKEDAPPYSPPSEIERANSATQPASTLADLHPEWLHSTIRDKKASINCVTTTLNKNEPLNSVLSLESFNSPVFEWSGSGYTGKNQEWARKIQHESNDAIAWFTAQNFAPIPTWGGLKVEAEYCFNMAAQAQDAGIIQEAWAGFYQALIRYCRLNDSKNISLTCFNLGKVYGVRQNWELAMLMFLHSVYLTMKLGDQKGYAWSVFYLSDAVDNLGDSATAKLFLAKEALPVFQRVLPENVADVESCIRRLAEVDAETNEAVPGGATVLRFDVVLTNIGPAKLAVVKKVCELTGLELKAAKDLVENVPGKLKEAVKEPEAKSIIDTFADIGASVEAVPINNGIPK